MAFAEDIKRVFRVFSRRHADDARAAGQEVSRETRTRLLHVYRELVGWANNPFDNQTAYTYWSRLHDLLSTLKGDWVLSQRFKQHEPFDRTRPHHDVAAFVYECTTKELFAFIELSFQVKELEMLMEDSRDAIQSINQILAVDDIPYRLTDFVRNSPQRRGLPPSIMIHPSAIASNGVISYPAIVPAEEEFLYEEATEPALQVLANPEFAAANAEFRAALKNYREQDLRDCLSNCASALESVLKVLSEQHRLTYSDSDTLSPLLDRLIPNLGLEQVYAENFKLLATIRNRLSSSHGGGTQPRSPEKHFAQLMLNDTAAAIVFLVQVSEAKRPASP